MDRPVEFFDLFLDMVHRFNINSRSDPEESVLIGMVFDVSGSMKRHVTRRSGRSESLASSIFRVMDDLLSGNDLWRNEVFAFGVGTNKSTVAFDILRTLDRHQRDHILKEVMQQKARNEKCSLPVLVRYIIDILKNNGASSIRVWTTDKQVESVITLETAALFAAAARMDEQFLSRVVNECLPSVCRSAPIDKSPLLLLPFGLVCSLAERTASLCTSNSAKKEEVEQAMKKAKELWTSLHPDILPIDTSRSVFDGKRALEILRGSALTSEEEELTNERVDKLMESIEPYIYGGTPLIGALEEAVNVFRGNKAEKKVLFVLSDGKPTDGDHAPANALRDLGVHVVCCYVTDEHIEGKRLYAVEDPNWNHTAKFMFNLSSSISTHHVPRTVFVQRDWKIDFAKNECKLFAQVNNPDLLKDVTQLVRDVVSSQDSLSDLLGSISLDLFINHVNDEFSPKEQIKSTCYANAAAAVMYMAMKRIYKRQATPLPDHVEREEIGYPYFYENEVEADPDNFKQLREELIEEFGKEGADIFCVLSAVCPRYRLRWNEVTLVGAMKAVSCKRPVVVTFRLTKKGWKDFGKFFQTTPRGILDKTDLGSITGEDGGGHAVVLTSYNSEGLRFMNSWGTNWGDSGFFMVKRDALQQLKFYDVFWVESDLTESEKLAYAESGKEAAGKLISKYQSLNTLRFACPLCRQVSLMIKFRSRGDNAVCPRCAGPFPSRGYRPELTLCLYLHSLARGARSEQ